MKITVSACVLAFVILALYQGCHAEDPVKNEPKVSNREVGRDFTITCHGEGRMHVSRQKLTGNIHQSEWNETIGENGIHEFKIPKVTEVDTGWYACVEEGNEIQNDEQTIKHLGQRWMYLYVNSPKPFAVMNIKEIIAIEVVAGRNVVIPCRPTSPDLQVDLWDVIRQVSITDHEYDPQVGFIIRDVNDTYDKRIFECRINGTDIQTSARYNLIVSAPEPLRKPVMRPDNPTHVILGKDLELSCRITAPKGDHIDMDWRVPSSERMTKNRTNNSKSGDGHKGNHTVWESVLRIKKVDRSHGGEYICHAKRSTDQVSSSIQVQIWEPGNITGGEIKEVKLNQPAALSCHVDGYSLSNFNWPKIDDSERHRRLITEEVHFSSTNTSAEMYLNFTSVTRGDNGIYECRVEDYESTLISNTSLIVTEVPEVTIDTATSEGADCAYLNWTIYDGNKAVTAYHIQQRKKGTEQWENCTGEVNVTLSSYIAKELEKNTVYEFSITAKNAIGSSKAVQSVPVRTLEKDNLPDFVTEVTVEQLSETSIKVYWTPPEGAIRDRFQYYNLLARYGNDIRKAINLPLNVTTYVFHDLRSGEEYKVELQTCNMYTGKCVTNKPPQTKGIGYSVAVWSGFIAAFFVFLIVIIWMIIRRRREKEWRRNFTVAAYNLSMENR